MFVERYRAHDRTAVAHLLKKRGMWTYSAAEQLPKLGFVVYAERETYDSYDAVCAGFLREVEGGSYLFDSLISNPDLNSEQRNQGMQLLWKAIMDEAGKAGIIGFTTDTGTMQRAIEAGFQQLPHTTLSYKRGK